MKRNTAELKKRLVQTGIENIRESGLDQLSLRTIAKACGVTHGTPYRHFGSKDGYLKVVLAELSDFFSQEMLAGVDSRQPARDRLSRMGLNFIQFARSYPYFFEALILKFPFHFWEMDRGTSTITSAARLPGFDTFQTAVESLIRDEELRRQKPEAMIHLWSFISGLAIVANSPDGRQLDTAALQASIDQMLTIYIEGGH